MARSSCTMTTSRCTASLCPASCADTLEYLLPGPPVLCLQPLHWLGQVANLHDVLKVDHGVGVVVVYPLCKGSAPIVSKSSGMSPVSYSYGMLAALPADSQPSKKPAASICCLSECLADVLICSLPMLLGVLVASRNVPTAAAPSAARNPN